MKEAFDIALAGVCLSGLAAIGTAFLVNAVWTALAKRARAASGRPPAWRLAFLAAPVVFALGMILYGGSKGLLQDGTRTTDASSSVLPLVSELDAEVSPAPLSLAESASSSAQTSDSATEASATAVHPFAGEPKLVGQWWRRGAFDDGEVVEVPKPSDWRFPWRGGHLTRFEVRACGAVYASEREAEPIARFATPLSLKPHASRVLHGLTTNDAYRIEWRDAHPNRDEAATADAFIELRRNGDVILSEGGVEALLPYVIPFPHDGFGQDDEWVRANFPNADQILAAGYPDWVDAQVGTGLTNGLYKFTATFPETPPEPVQLLVGDYSVCVTNAGEYVFILKKGVEHRFGTRPHVEAVRYSHMDDIPTNGGLLRAAAAWRADGVWTVGGGDVIFSPPTALELGLMLWMPTLRGHPDVAHLWPGDDSVLFSAQLSDYCGSPAPSFHWASSDDAVTFDAPDERETSVSFTDMPSWRPVVLSVQAKLGGLSLWSYLYSSYGTNETPRARIAINAPQAFAVNGERRELSVRFSSDCATNATVSVRCVNGGDKVSLWTAESGGSSVGDSAQWNVVSSSDAMFSLFVQGSGVSEYEGVEFECQLETEDGCIQTMRVKATVLECHTQPIEDDAHRGYEVVNPSYLPAYSDAVSVVAVRPEDIPASEIRWRVVSGVATFPSGRNGLETTVRGVGGMVDLEISVLGATDERMHFKAKVQ